MMISIILCIKNITKLSCCYFLITIFSLLLSTLSHADSRLTTEEYVLLDQKVKKITVEGMASRLSTLQEAPYDRREQAALSNTVQDNIQDALKERGITMTDLLNYGARNSSQIRIWLDEHSAYKDIYQEIARQHEWLASQIQAIQE